MVFRKTKRNVGAGFIGPLLLAAALASPTFATTSFLGGVEDYPGMSPVEQNGDYNDLIFRLTGNVSVIAPDASFFALTPNIVNQSGGIFWDHPTIDGPEENLGFCALRDGNCPIQSQLLDQFAYLALTGGGAPLSVLFQADGAVTLDLLLELSAGSQGNTLGWYDPAHPEILHQIFSGPDTAGASVTFTPSSTFALYSSNILGNRFSSIAAGNVNESATQQHFALLEDIGASVPEPGTWSFVMIAIALLTGRRIYAMLKTRWG